MKQILFYIHNYPIYSYGLIVFLGLFLATAGFIISSRREGINFEKGMYLGMLTYIFGMVLARAASILINLDKILKSIDSLSLISIIKKGGFSVHGALAGGILAVYYFSREQKISFSRLLDLISPFAALGYSVGRIGCFLNGCCWGVKTHLPWSVSSPASTYHQELLSVHPVQLYDSYLSFLLFLFLLNYKNYKKFDGHLFLLFLLGSSVIRFFVEYFRWGVSAKIVYDVITQAQIASIFIIIASLILMKILANKGKVLKVED